MKQQPPPKIPVDAPPEVWASTAIQSHPLRAEMASALAERIGGDVVVDPDPDGFRSPWRTYRACLESTPAWATHRLVVQDDVEACPGFAAAALAAIRARPDRLIAFFVAGQPWDHRDAVLEACSRDEPWAELGNDRWCPTVALCWPVEMITPLLEYVDRQRWPVSFRADDEIVGRFLREGARARAVATVPSLIEHPDMTPSLVGKRHRMGLAPERVAACYIGSCDSCDDATAIDWG